VVGLNSLKILSVTGTSKTFPVEPVPVDLVKFLIVVVLAPPVPE
jgi:hypothetical protein